MKILINKISYTESEVNMMKAFYDTSVNCCGSCSSEENLSYNNADDLKNILGGTNQSIGGLMASLLKKGALSDMHESARGSQLNDFVLTDTDVMAYFDAIAVQNN
jgi:hypothetical protein